MIGSALRRNVAEHLGIASPAANKSKTYLFTDDEVAALKDWIGGCTLRHQVMEDHDAAKAEEAALKAEWRPKLTKR